MDDIVKQAMLKWPHVPACYGWLGLDARGDWYMRDDRTQALGTFTGGHSGAKGSRLAHPKLIDFIARNYASDERGCWFFQNGPQRVYVELEAAPWVWRIHPGEQLRSQTGVATVCTQALTDEYGWVYLATPKGLGVVHTHDVALVAEALDRGFWQLETVRRNELPQRFRFVLSPQQQG